MSKDVRMEEESFSQASLDGHLCKAVAWVQATSVDVFDGQGQVRRVQGVRRWRGKALIDRDAFPSGLSGSPIVRYTGTLKDGEKECTINAEVFLYFSQHERNTTQQTYVEFIGAGKPTIIE